jgi:hypothetical protein
VVIVLLWLSLYFVSEGQNPELAQRDARAAAVLVSGPVVH